MSDDTPPHLAAAIDPDVGAAFVLEHAERLVKVASMCVISCGLASGLNDALQDNLTGDFHWDLGTLGFRDATLMTAILRTALLLDRDERVLSFQTMHRHLKSPAVQSALTDRLAVGEIDWKVHERLTHLRNLGVAHLTVEQMRRSITLRELETLVTIIARLTDILQSLCRTPTAFRTDMLKEYPDCARQTVLKGRPS